MGSVNQLGTLGAHPKPVTTQEVRQAFVALTAVVEWYLVEYKNGLGEPAEAAEPGAPLATLASNSNLGLDSFGEKDAERFFRREDLLEQDARPLRAPKASERT